MPKVKSEEKKRYVRDDGLMEKQVTISGKRKVFRGRTEREILKKIAAYKGEVERGRPFKEIALEWQREHWAEIEYNTTKNYNRPFTRAIDHFTDTPIKQITPQDITVYLALLAEDKLAQKTIRACKLVCNLIFNYAILKGEADINPCTYAAMPKGLPKQRRELPTEDEIEVVKNSIGCTYGLFHFFILYTGCRKGEALAIKFGDIDRESKIIHINKSMYFEGSTPRVKRPKTSAGTRDIVLLDILAEKLPEGDTDTYLFFPNNKPDYKTTIDRRIKRWKKETGLTVTPHQLRHAYATILYEAGIDEKAAQELLGHASIAMTKDIYTHISKSKAASTADQLNNFVNQNTQQAHSNPAINCDTSA